MKATPFPPLPNPISVVLCRAVPYRGPMLRYVTYNHCIEWKMKEDQVKGFKPHY